MPTLPALGPSAESLAPTAPLQGCPCRLQCHSSGSTGKAEVPYSQRAERLSVSWVHHGLEPVPFFTSSRHLQGNIQGESPTGATSPVLESFFIPFIAIIPSSFWLSTVAAPLEKPHSCPAWSFPRSFLATFKTDNALPTFCSFIPLFQIKDFYTFEVITWIFFFFFVLSSFTISSPRAVFHCLEVFLPPSGHSTRSSFSSHNQSEKQLAFPQSLSYYSWINQASGRADDTSA